MRIELKQNRIVIVLTKAESDFLAQKAAAEQINITSYVKANILKALDLKGFEDSATVELANNFNLAKIKHVSTELSQRKASLNNNNVPDDEVDLIIEEDLIDELLEEGADIGDEILADLLDKDLLKGPKSRKHSQKPKSEDD